MTSLQLPPIAPSAYQQALETGATPPRLSTDTVRFWSDYNHLFYHPRSIVQLNEYELNSSLMPFELWGTGEELFQNLDREHDLLDRDLRPFLEECDQLQGLQIFSSTDDAWGGFAARYLERVFDELGKGCRWMFGLTNGSAPGRQRQMIQLTNFAQSIYMLDSITSVHIPLSVPNRLPSNMEFDRSSLWHTSALQSTLMESITLPTRLRADNSSHATFDQLEATLNYDGHRRIATAGMSIEDPGKLGAEVNGNGTHDTRMTNGVTEEDHEDVEAKSDIDMFPVISSGSRQSVSRVHTFSRIESLRGNWDISQNMEDADVNQRNRFADGPRRGLHKSQLLFPMLPSYPQVFRFGDAFDNVAVNASLSTNTHVADRVRSLERSVRAVIGVDEREALCDGLSTIAEEYEEGWDFSDDDDEGD